MFKSPICRSAAVSLSLFLGSVGIAPAQGDLGARIRNNPEAVLSLSMDGPAKIWEVLADATFGKLYASPEVSASFSALLESLPDPRLEQVRDTLLAYRGRLDVSVSLQRAEEEHGDPRGLLMVYLSADGETEFAEMVALAEEAATEIGGDVADQEIGDRVVRIVGDPDAECVLLPTQIDGGLLFAFGAGGQLVQGIEELLLPREDTPVEAVEAPPVDLAIKLTKLWPFLAWAIAEDSWLFEEADVMDAFEAFGVTTLETATLSLAAQGEFTVTEMAVTETVGVEGMLDRYFPKKRASTIDLGSRSEFNWFALGFDLVRFARDWIDFVRSQEGGDEVDAQLDMMHEQTGVRLDDLLGSIGADWLFSIDLGMPADEFEEETGGAAIGLSLRDEGVFAECLDKLLKSAGLYAGRRTSSYRDLEVYAYSIPFPGAPAIEYSVSDGFLVLGVGPDGGEKMRTVLDSILDKRAGTEPVAFPAAVADRVAAFPSSDFVGFALQDTLAGRESNQAMFEEWAAELERANGPVAGAFMRALLDYVTATQKAAQQLDLRYAPSGLFRTEDSLRFATIF